MLQVVHTLSLSTSFSWRKHPEASSEKILTETVNKDLKDAFKQRTRSAPPKKQTEGTNTGKKYIRERKIEDQPYRTSV